VIEVREILRLWLDGRSLRDMSRLSGAEGRHRQSQLSCTGSRRTERNVGRERTFAQVDVFASRPYGGILSRSSLRRWSDRHRHGPVRHMDQLGRNHVRDYTDVGGSRFRTAVFFPSR